MPKQHLRALVIYAFRYCLGRASYAGPEGVELVRAHAHELLPHERKLIAREIREANVGDFAFGWDWTALAEELEVHP